MALILAAGKGKRMRSKHAKVLHTLAGQPMIRYSLAVARELSDSGVIIVVGYKGKEVKAALGGGDLKFVDQGDPQGSGHAVLKAQPELKNFKGNILILNGDVPLISKETLLGLKDLHHKEKADLSILSVELENPFGYGRITRKPDGGIQKIIEEADASLEERKISEVNSGFYLAEASFLFEVLKEVNNDNSQKEYYLTDIVKVALRKNKKIAVFKAPDSTELLGINSRRDLAQVEALLFRKSAEKHMDNGVTLHDPDSIRIDSAVEIGRDTEIFPNVRIEGKSSLGEDCLIRSYTRISDCRLAVGVVVREGCVLSKSKIGNDVTVGPFAHIRPGSVLSEGSKVGNFVETKETILGKGSKANHLSYLGDAEIGEGVNIGAGTITCNYDGIKKSRTLIEDGVFVGSGTQFIAPVTVGKGAVIGAGSTITRDVAPESLALSRSEQISKKDWAKKKKASRE